MSQPHHFVFNEIERTIRSSVPHNNNLVDLLIEKKVLRGVDRTKFTGKNGMKCLTSFMRIKDFETFVTFLECIRDVGETDDSVDVSILETVRGAVKTFDENHGTQYEEKIPLLKKTIGSTSDVVPITSTVLSVPENSSESLYEQATDQSSVHIELNHISVVGNPKHLRVGVEGSRLHSPLTDFEIEIPPKAVKAKQCITIKAATCVFGEFELPNDVYRISDFICVTTDGQLQSPVTVSIAHCLRMPEYTSTEAVVVYHADMKSYIDSKFNFSLLKTIPQISSTTPFLSLEVKDFCIFCAVYCPRYYRGIQKKSHHHEQSVCKDHPHQKKNTVSPYHRPVIPKLDYVLLFYEQKHKTSPYHIWIFSCLNCPGSIEFCNKRMMKRGLWKDPISRNFDFTSTKIVYMDIVEIKSEGWQIASKSSCINECDIQRPNMARFEGLKADRERARCYTEFEDILYPPSMSLEAVNISTSASCLQFSIAIKDAKEGDYIVPDPYEVVLPQPALLTGNQNVHKHSTVKPIKRSLSAEEEQCLQQTVTTPSLARVTPYITNWKLAADKLGISKLSVSQIEQECSYKCEPISEVIYKMLYRWHQCSTERTYNILVEALRESDEDDAVNFILGNITTLSTLSPLTNTV